MSQYPQSSHRKAGSPARPEGRKNPTPYYRCLKYHKSRQELGCSACSPTCYSVYEIEQAVSLALLDACRRPEAISAAIAAYQESGKERSKTAADPRDEIKRLDTILASIADRERAAVQAQITGIMQGVSPDAYAEVFADLAIQRKDLENRGENFL